MQSKIELQSEIDTQNIVKPVSYYKSYSVSPIGSVPTALTNTTNPVITFELSADTIINFSRIIFSFSRDAIGVTHAVNTRAGINNNYLSFISRIECYTGSGNLKLLDLNNADLYSKASCHLMNDYLKNSPSNGIMYPRKNANSKSIIVTGSNPVTSVTVTDVNTDYLATSGIVKNSINTYQNYEFSADTVDAPIPANDYSIRLGDAFGDTIFNLNKSIYISKSIFIRFTFNNASKIVCGFNTGSGAPAAAAVNVNGIPVSNFSLKTYSENDPLIIEQLKKQNDSGVSYVMPDVVVNQLSVSGAGTKGLQTKYSNMTGNTDSRLYKCYSLLNATGNGSANALYPTSNYQYGKYTYLSLFVNSMNILNFDIQNTKDDIQHMIMQHANHSITDDDTIKDNGVICNVFDTSPAEKEYKNDELKGLAFGPSGDITINWQYTIAPPAANVVSGSAVYDNYQFGIILKKLWARRGELSATAF